MGKHEVRTNSNANPARQCRLEAACPTSQRAHSGAAIAAADAVDVGTVRKPLCCESEEGQQGPHCSACYAEGYHMRWKALTARHQLGHVQPNLCARIRTRLLSKKPSAM